MNRRCCLKSFLLALAPAPALAKPAARSLNDELERIRAKHELPALAAAVAGGGAIVASGAVGARVRGRDIKVAIDDRFHLGSDTKAMTATLAGMAVDEGRLQWTATIGDVLGGDVSGLNSGLAAVSLEQLLSHSGGVPGDTEEIAKLYLSPDAFELSLPAQRLRVLSAWTSHAPETPPGSTFRYANLGYIIAGAMIEKAFGISWEELVTARLFEPLGLHSAGLGPQATMGKYDAPVGHQLSGRGAITPMPWGPAADVPPVMGPAGVAHMSILDFAAWAAWNAGRGKRGPALVKPETLERIHRPHVSTGKSLNARPGAPQEGAYALGWGVVKFDWSPEPLLTHTGSNGMNVAKILVDAERDLGVVVLSNFPVNKADAAASSLMATLYRRYAI